MRILLAFALGALSALLPQFGPRAADAANPPDSPPTPTANVALPGSPFGVAMSRDGNWVFVAITRGRKGAVGVALLGKENGKFVLKRLVPLDDGPTGIVLTHDGKNLVAAMNDSVAVLDVQRMISGATGPVVASFSDGNPAGSIYVNVTADDKTLFVSNEADASITVVDLDRVRRSGFDARAVIGKIPVGQLPIALTFSPDGRWLYTTSERALPAWGWPATEKAEEAPPDPPEAKKPPGAVIVVDVARARTDPTHSVVARVPAGSTPVRMAISPDGRRIYVTARRNDSVLAFDTAKLITDPNHALLASAPVGRFPVPVAVIQRGRKLVVGNSNRFSRDAQKASTLTVIDAARIGQPSAVLGTIPAGSFPREMCVSADGKTLLVANYGSDSLEIIDAENPPIQTK